MIRILRLIFLVATPLVLAVVLWFHPPGGETVYEGVRDDVGEWLFVHTAFLFFIDTSDRVTWAGPPRVYGFAAAARGSSAGFT